MNSDPIAKYVLGLRDRLKAAEEKIQRLTRELEYARDYGRNANDKMDEAILRAEQYRLLWEAEKSKNEGRV